MKAYRSTDEWVKAGVYYVRTEAMVFDFGVPLWGEFSEDTPESEFVLVTDDDGKPLSTCRIHAFLNEGFAKIERVATVTTARKQGAGRLAIEEAEKWIKEKGISKVIITSRDEAVGFYEKLGYKTDYTKDARKMFPSPKKEGEKDRKPDPRFILVVVEKEI